jgi:hypothetical protein
MLKKINQVALLVFAAGFLMIFYGLLARGVGIYFFWESSAIGWVILFVGAIWALFSLRRYRRSDGRKGIGEGIGIFFAAFFLLTLLVGYPLISHLEATAAAREYLLTNDSIRSELGGVNGVVLMPELVYKGTGEKGACLLEFVVKGNKKYVDVGVYLSKAENSPWTVTDVRPFIRNH